MNYLLVSLLLFASNILAQYSISWNFISGSKIPNFIDSYNRSPAARYQGGLVVGNKYIWIYGGVNHFTFPQSLRDQYLSDLFKLTLDDVESATWELQKIMLNKDSIAGVTGSYGHCNYDGKNMYPPMMDTPNVWTLDDDLYMLGGCSYEPFSTKYDYINYDDTFWKFSPKTGNWTRITGSGWVCFTDTPYPPTPPMMRHGSFFWQSGKDFYLFGGKHFDTHLNDVWKYSTTENKWTQICPNQDTSDSYPRARAFASGWFDSEGYLWIYGGEGDNGATLGDLWVMSPEGKWKYVNGDTKDNVPPYHSGTNQVCQGNTPGSREGAISWTDGQGRLLLLGGGNGNLIYSDLWIFDPATNGWAYLQDITTLGHRKSASTWVDTNGKLWIFGGESSLGGFADLWNGVTSGELDYC